ACTRKPPVHRKSGRFPWGRQDRTRRFPPWRRHNGSEAAFSPPRHPPVWAHAESPAPRPRTACGRSRTRYSRSIRSPERFDAEEKNSCSEASRPTKSETDGKHDHTEIAEPSHSFSPNPYTASGGRISVRV